MVAVALATVVLVEPATPAEADAQIGTCGSGYRLTQYDYAYPGYNGIGQLMWKITWRKRLCYNATQHRIGSVYAPPPEVLIYNFYTAAWTNEGLVSSDSYYSDRDARGTAHPSFPRWRHVSWFKIRLDHCVIKMLICAANYYEIGTVSYSDGAKNVIVP
ncbi:MAG: hypothetical protein JWR52_1046 [Marmoricola sp.]|nr:hypothetical protein [Marmoricola sp.]